MECVISCEHASNGVPPHFAYLFKGEEQILSSHRAYDPGAADLARWLATSARFPVHLGTVTRLLIDLNRSPTNKRTLFSEYSRNLGKNERDMLLQNYYLPYRYKVEKEIDSLIAESKPVLHISVHSFAPAKDNRERKADIGLLYDPGRGLEKNMCAFLAELLSKEVETLQVRKNYPYLGIADGFTSFLRRKYPGRHYVGIEIEMNQALLSQTGPMKKRAEVVLRQGIGILLRLQDVADLS